MKRVLRARNQLGTPGGAKSFLRGAQIFGLCPIALNHVQHIFPGGGEKFSRGGFALPALPLWLRAWCTHYHDDYKDKKFRQLLRCYQEIS